MESQFPYAELTSIALFPLGDMDIYRESFVAVQHPESIRGDKAYKNGVYDEHMGTNNPSVYCKTCLHNKNLCPGHPGHVRLNQPVPSPMFLRHITRWLKIICFNCGRPVIGFMRFPVPRERIINEYTKQIRNSKENNCVFCGELHPNVIKDRSDPITFMVEYNPSRGGEKARPIRAELPAYKIARILGKVRPEYLEKMGLPRECLPSKFINSYIRAPPNTIRPEIRKMGGRGGNNDINDVTVLLQSVIKINQNVPSSIVGEPDENTRVMLHNLSLAVYSLMKGGGGGTDKRTMISSGRKELRSIMKRLMGKTGRIRGNLLGRRTKFCGRGFITCNVGMRNNEISVPISICRDISVPVVVREYNYEECLIYFMNGTKRYPGCKRIREGRSGEERDVNFVQKLEIGDTIYRDIITGDYVQFNRQPTLLPSSITTMRIVVDEYGDTIGLNVTCCVFFNADFDGDAMNLFFAQNTITQNEIQHLSTPAQMITSYKNGALMLGLVHDGLMGMAELTRSGTKMDKLHAMQLFAHTDSHPDFSNLGGEISGRETVSRFLQATGNYINYSGKATMYEPMYEAFYGYDTEEISVNIDRGNLTKGVLDKAAVGQEQHGSIYHIIHNQYGPHQALSTIYNMQQMGLNFMAECRGLTVHMGDLLLRAEDMEGIRRVEQSIIAESYKITQRLNEGLLIPPIGKTVEEYYEELQINALDPGDKYWEYVFHSIDPETNNIFKMINYGARGKPFNLKNISCAVGQIQFKGGRLPEQFGGRATPFALRGDIDPTSRGFVEDSYMSGLKPKAFMTHARDNRDTLIARGISTAEAGEQGRMGIKNLESLVVNNMRAMAVNSKILQPIYGGDGIDPRFIQRVRFVNMRADYTEQDFRADFYARAADFGADFNNAGAQKILDEEFQQMLDDRKFFMTVMTNRETAVGRKYSDSAFMPVNVGVIIEDTIYNMELRKHKAATINPLETVRKTRELCENLPYCLLNEIQQHSKAELPAHIQCAVIFMQILIRGYLCCRYLQRKSITDAALDIIIRNIRTTFLKSLVSYGKCMGVIAAQVLSEPMTQMVLNSHHTSGAGSTKKIGMFRIKEILSAQKTEKMKAPSMTLFIKPEYQTDKIKVQEIANHIEMLKLGDFVSGWQIFFERYGNPVHPSYKHEREMIHEFEKYNTHIKAPGDLMPWCIRFELNKSKLIEKQLQIETVYHILRTKYPPSFIVYNSDNNARVIMRVYFRATIFRKSDVNVKIVRELAEKMLGEIIRGLRGVIAAYVKERELTEIDKNAMAKTRKIYIIFCDGTNLAEAIRHPLVDSFRSQSDSIDEMYQLFGIGCARQKIIDEFRDQVPGPDYRHFTVFADTMTQTGVVTSINRHGITRRNREKFMLRISDAAPVPVIDEAAANAFKDTIDGVSSCIMVGKNPHIGDLYNDFVLDEEFVAENVKNIDALIEEL